MLAFSPGQAVIALPTTLETASCCGDRLTYIRLVNESSNLVKENKSSLPNENLNQDNSDLDDEIPF